MWLCELDLWHFDFKTDQQVIALTKRASTGHNALQSSMEGITLPSSNAKCRRTCSPVFYIAELLDAHATLRRYRVSDLTRSDLRLRWSLNWHVTIRLSGAGNIHILKTYRNMQVCIHVLYSIAFSATCLWRMSCLRHEYDVRPSVCLSVCPSVCNVGELWSHSARHCRIVDTTRKGNHSSFLTPTMVGGRRPFLSEIFTQSDPLRKTPTSTDFRL